MNEKLVSYDQDGDIALIGLNRPEKHNALSRELSAQLKAAAIRAGEEARVAVVYSHGENFCAGLDLREASTWMTNQLERFRHRMLRNGRAFEDIARSPIPVIAAISGACIGGGGSVRIARLLGVGRMTDLMLTGRVLTTAEAERFGVIQYAVAKGKHLERAKSLAARVAENAPMTNWAIVNGLPRIQDFSHEDGLFVEGLLSGTVSTPESGERLKAFLEKRAKPLGKPGTSGDGQQA
jgi:enoyl-CoA hydratase/carnithine racemase